MSATAPGFSVERRENPARTVVSDESGGWRATFTDGAFTVTLVGPARTFTAVSAADPVIHDVWVRALPQPWDGNFDHAWLAQALEDNALNMPDLLAIAMQYVAGAPPLVRDGLQIAGDAGYGPLMGGQRQEGADFNDYLGLSWSYPEKTDAPEPAQQRCLDCSGYVRMVFGYRAHLPLCLQPCTVQDAIPRRAFQIYESGPGVVTILDKAVQPSDFSPLSVGDLVFFDADAGDNGQLDHVGIYLGADAGAHHRFLSSRKGANGPTLGDYKGKSILDGTGHYANAFRSARRL